MSIQESQANPPEAKLSLNKAASNYMKYLEYIESCSPLTLRAYRLDLDQTFPGLWRDEKIHLLEALALLKEARKAQQKWSNLTPASRNRKSSTLKSFFGYLFQENLIESDIASQIHSPKVPRKIPHFLSVDEMISVFKSFGQDTKPAPLEKLLFLLLYGSGLRVSEACSLTWAAIDFNQQTLRIRGKGNKERIVALPKSVRDLIQNLKIASETLPVDPSQYVWGAHALSTRKAYDWVRARGAKAGLLRPIHPHALRHSFATHLLASGANLRTLQELLGHESLQATEKYTHLGVDQLARTLERHHPFGRK